MTIRWQKECITPLPITSISFFAASLGDGAPSLLRSLPLSYGRFFLHDSSIKPPGIDNPHNCCGFWILGCGGIVPGPCWVIKVGLACRVAERLASFSWRRVSWNVVQYMWVNCRVAYRSRAVIRKCQSHVPGVPRGSMHTVEGWSQDGVWTPLILNMSAVSRLEAL